MVKMSYAPLPNLLPINTSNIGSNNLTKTSLSEVLQSDPVKRLFNQPNIIIKAVPLSSRKQPDIFENKKNGINTTLNIKPPEISIVSVKISDEEKEDAHLLPSKIEDKKSEITLLPVKKKICGHYEPCENIICDVTVQQYVDKDGVSPMLAINIEEDEINAPVAKHCKNKYCDALSIDHNRCRRALIKLHCCAKSHICDICGITLKGWKSRINHKHCTRKDEYRHNNVDRMHLLKERMRERELQILEIAKMKKNDYSDPVRAMETLRKNEELIIIPKTAPSQQPIITITSVPSTQSTGINLSNAQSIKINSQGDNLYDIPASIFRNIPFAISSQNTTISDNTSRPVENKNQVKFPNLQQDSYITSTLTTVPSPAVTSAATPVVPPQNKYVRLATSSQTTTNIQPIAINNWVMSSPHLLTTTPIQPKPFLTPIRLVPITNLITAPSLLHRTQGIPKFCIMAENLVTPVTIPNPPPPQPAVAATATNTNTQQESTLKIPTQQDSIRKRKSQKKMKKSFFCDYCSKHFSTDWYFKMHIAKHKGEKLFFCNLCDDSFSNKYDMKKHMNKQHDGHTELACDKCDYVCTSPGSFKTHVKTHAVVSNEEEIDILKRILQYSKDEINHTMLVNSYNEKIVKKIKRENISDSSDKNKEVSINGKTTQEDSLKTTCVKKHNNEELSTINRDDNAKTNGFVCVSVEKNTDIT